MQPANLTIRFIISILLLFYISFCSCQAETERINALDVKNPNFLGTGRFNYMIHMQDINDLQITAGEAVKLRFTYTNPTDIRVEGLWGSYGENLATISSDFSGIVIYNFRVGIIEPKQTTTVGYTDYMRFPSPGQYIFKLVIRDVSESKTIEDKVIVNVY